MTPRRPAVLHLEKNYNDFYSAVGAAALILGIAITAILTLGGGVQELLGLLATLGLFWLLLVTVIGLNNRRIVERERRDAESLFTGAAWAVWQWSIADWQQELRQRQQDHEKRVRFQRFTPWLGGIAGIIIGGSALLPAVIAGDEMPPSIRTFVIGLAIFFALLAVALSVVGAGRERRKWEAKLEAARQLTVPWICFGPYGFYHQVDGHTSLRNLGGISFSKKKQVISFYIKYALPRGGSMLHAVPVTIPESGVAEADALVERYRTERSLRD
ncbi:MAG: hypothetical protein J0M33_04990 [Anaerolineae bacterium]|nr:hypothetical protein [Anaerolineae bacterium]